MKMAEFKFKFIYQCIIIRIDCLVANKNFVLLKFCLTTKSTRALDRANKHELLNSVNDWLYINEVKSVSNSIYTIK